MNTVLEKSARAAGEVIMSYFHKEAHMRHKTSHRNLVTDADVASQNTIRKTITSELLKQGIQEKEIGFIGEENLSTAYAPHMFVIDPLDGTNNFASGLDYFAVSIAYFKDNVLSESVIYWPSRDILYYASRGKGAFKKDSNGTETRLAVKDELLENSVILTYISSDELYQKETLTFVTNMLAHVRGLRFFGSACIDYVHLADPENTVHIVYFAHTYLWDCAAAYLIIAESGGICTDRKGNKVTLELTSGRREYEILAAHPNVIKEIIKYL